MWIVRVALNRPYTFIVLALLILILSPVVILRTPTDIFPNIDIPVIAVAWQFTGLNPEEMEGRITTGFERVLTTTVDNIEHIESTTVSGQSMVKIFLQPNARLDTANAQVTAISQTALRQLPPGVQPPLIINYSASTVPILQLALSGLSESELNDIGLNFLRTQLVTVPGASIPFPYGGKQRQVMVDLDQGLLQSKGLAPADVVNALGQQNIVLPSGTAKIGEFEYDVAMNASPRTVAELNDLPVKVVGNSTIYLRDVAHVRDGFTPQTNVVRRDGQRGTLVTILKTGAASTLDVVRGVRDLLPRVIPTLPPQLTIQPLADQSIFVRAAVSGVIREAVIAACLTAVMILIFLGSWRSTLIIAVSIPLSILTSVITLGLLGETINIMTLGGLALAVGILVDDATVEVENINRNLDLGKPILQAILDGAQQIAVPGVVPPVADARTHPREIPAPAGGRGRAAVAKSAGSRAAGVRARVRAGQARLPAAAHDAGRAAGRLHPGVPGRLSGRLPARAAPRRELLPRHRQRAVHPAPASPDRHPHRGDRATDRPRGGVDPPRDPGRRDGRDPRQHRAAL